MRNASFTRKLKPSEIELARKVFHSALPSWDEIGITDGLGKDDTVWTIPRSMIPFAGALSSSIKYLINFGDAAKVDVSVTGTLLSKYVPGYGANLVPNVFIHELTHAGNIRGPMQVRWKSHSAVFTLRKSGPATTTPWETLGVHTIWSRRPGLWRIGRQKRG